MLLFYEGAQKDYKSLVNYLWVEDKPIKNIDLLYNIK
jgi:hypothetical protein